MEVGEPPWRAAEVMALLRLERLSYQRLQALGDLVFELSPGDAASRDLVGPGSWRTYTPKDVARICVVIELCGDQAFNSHTGGTRHRLRGIAHLRRAARLLMGPQFNVADPLLDVSWIRQGRNLLVLLAGDLIDPLSGQSLVRWGSAEIPRLLDRVATRSDPQTRHRLLQAFPRTAPQPGAGLGSAGGSAGSGSV
ncbi:hypothetical protein GCM10022275_22640 [Tessaracoccus defluvii]